MAVQLVLNKKKPLIAEIIDVFSKTPDAKLKSVEKPRKVLYGASEKERQLRKTLLAGESSSFKITTWVELVDQVPVDVTTKFKSVN